MRPVFSDQAWEGDLFWQKTDKKLLHRINGPIKGISPTPHEGAGEPEPLEHALWHDTAWRFRGKALDCSIRLAARASCRVVSG